MNDLLHLYSLSPVTTDVSSVVVTLDCPTLNISCHLLPGSLARGCFVSLIPISQKPGETDQGSVVNKTVARTNSSLEARAVLVLTPHSCCHQLQVYDWEDDGSTGLISIPLTTESMLCDIPEVVTGDNTTGSNRGKPVHMHFCLVTQVHLHIYLVSSLIASLIILFPSIFSSFVAILGTNHS